jgi:eukaryotic-like serine/threonine-protein kinase
LVCPQCRHHVEDPPGGKLLRCPNHHDRIMVPVHALADADGDPFLGLLIGGRFAVLERLGAGSMGTVYRARQEAMGRDVALKIVRSDRLVDPQAKGRFQQEAHATSLLTSPHTVTVYDFGEVAIEGDDPYFLGGSLYLAMELLEGESLGGRLKRVGRLPPGDAARIVRQALLSLAEAHEKGVIHRDLKPDNLLLLPSPTGGDEICKVLDFGIAKLVTREERGIDALETQAGTVFGTPRYMSPEQAQGKKLDARSDVYSLGVILYHMLLGRPPYTDGDAVVVMAHHIKTVPKRPMQADPDLVLAPKLEDLLMRVLEKDPARRPQSAQQFVAELDALGPLDTGASAELTAVVGRVAASTQSRRRMLLGAVVAGVVGVTAAALVTGSNEVAEGVAPAAGSVARQVGNEAQSRAADHARQQAALSPPATPPVAKVDPPPLDEEVPLAEATASASASASSDQKTPPTGTGFPKPPPPTKGKDHGYVPFDKQP